MTAAVVVRCAGRQGRCRKILGYAHPTYWFDDWRAGGTPTHPVLILRRAGNMTYEDAVLASFEGATELLGTVCERHSKLARPTGWTSGDASFPFALLREPAQRYAATQKAQEVLWAPWG